MRKNENINTAKRKINLVKATITPFSQVLIDLQTDQLHFENALEAITAIESNVQRFPHVASSDTFDSSEIETARPRVRCKQVLFVDRS